ncbi:MAG: lipoate--protein ligase [Lentisphaeria bacterium]|nr:lipoate--protein ligase [Lentisphaeria bacterium]
MKFFYNSSGDAPFNLALEELIASRIEEDIFMLWRNRSAVIIGRNQNTAAEVDSTYAKEKGIQIVRRMTGGGAVYHDFGNINYTICTAGRQLEESAFARNAACVVEALHAMDIPAEFSGRNDIIVDGKKISGSAKTVLSSRTLFHGTLLFDTDLPVLTRVLTPDPEKIRAKGIKSVRSRVGNLREYFPNMTVEDFIAAFTNEIISINNAVLEDIPEKLKLEAEELADKKYRTWQWNYGSAMSYSFTKKRRFDFGSVQLNFNVKENCIADLAICGDFFGDNDISILCRELEGTSLEPDALAAAVKKIPVEKFIHGAESSDIISLFEL